MTTSPVAPAPLATALRVGPEVREVLAAVAARTDASVLLADASGAVVEHVLHLPVPDAVAQAVLGKQLRPLSAAVRRPRAVAVLPAGPVVQVTVDGARWTVAPLADGELWVGCDPERVLERLHAELAALTHALDSSGDDPVGLGSVLRDEAPLPPALADRPLVLLAVRTDDPAGLLPGLRRALDARGLPHLADRTGRLLCAARPAELSRLVAASLGPCAAAVVATVDAPPFGALAEVVDAALAVAPAGQVSPVEALACPVRLAAAAAAAAAAPVLHDPVPGLLAQDARSPADLGGSLLAWLDAHGDVVTAASRLGVHVNTLRYRVRRARALLEADLDDPAQRLDVHLRLRALLGPTTR